MPGPMNSQDIPLHTEMQCQVCVKENSRYTCPGCGLQFCSVSCSKTHKSVSGCEGKRNKTAFVSKDEFNDTHMFSDLGFLEETHNLIDNASRENLGMRPLPSSNILLPDKNISNSRFPNKQLIRQCKLRGITLKLMPKGMKRHESNKSIFHSKSHEIFWTLDWSFPDCKVSYTKHRVKESTTIDTLIKLQWNSTENGPSEMCNLNSSEALSSISDSINSVQLFLVKNEVPANTPTLYALDRTWTLGRALRGKVIIEYPSLVAIVHGNMDKYTIIPISDQSDDSIPISSAVNQSEEKEKEIENATEQQDINVKTIEPEFSNDPDIDMGSNVSASAAHLLETSKLLSDLEKAVFVKENGELESMELDLEQALLRAAAQDLCE